MLRIKLRDIQRATLPLQSGNEGWIGVSARGDEYHVVVPVDVQIARGVMACNIPADGTPFGGHSNHLYFRCPPFSDEEENDFPGREQQIAKTAEDLIRWLASYGMEAEIEAEPPSPSTGERATISNGPARDKTPIVCPQCAREWSGLSGFLVNARIRLESYRACPDDFRRGRYVFAHSCGGTIEIPVSRFVRPRHRGRNLAGSHACPGFCSYEKSLSPCSAVCEGACYRRIAGRLRSRTGRAGNTGRRST